MKQCIGHIYILKLILDLEPKQNYIVHYRALKLYLQLGMKITRIHRILKFKQKPWLAPYIQKNKASNEFEKTFFKLINDAFFGKTMENVRKRRNINLVNTPEKLRKLVAQPTFKFVTSFHEELSAVERMKTKVMMNKPICKGLYVLELSKWLMYNFYYNVFKKNIFSRHHSPPFYAYRLFMCYHLTQQSSKLRILEGEIRNCPMS